MKEFDKIKKVKLTTEIVKTIRDFVISDQLEKGAKLPSERVLAEQIGVGRSSLREALRSLETLGLVEVVAGKGIFVAWDGRGVDKKGLPDIDSLEIITNKKITLLELLQVRELLECYSVKMASANATDKQLKQIEKRLIILENLYSAGIENRNEDVLFHQAINEASGNPMLPILFKTIFKLWISHDFGKNNVFLETLPFHRPIFESICRHDAKGAVVAVKRMLKITKKTILAQQKSD